MSTTVTYKGSTLTTVDNQTRTLKTAGKYMEGDVILTDVTSGGGTPTLQTKTVSYTPTELQQTATITADSGYDGLDEVDITVNAISSTYVGSGITQRSGSDLTASGATVSVPAGYYSAQTTKSVDTMTLPTSAAASATSGYTSKATISRSTSDQYINIPPGYNSAGGYYKISAIANGSATGPSTVSSTGASVSTSGTGTLTLTKTGVSTTPTVSAGYVSSATSSTATVTLSASVNIRSSSDLTSNTLTVTAPAGYYASAATKTLSDANLIAGNIKKNVSIFGMTGTYKGEVNAIEGTFTSSSSSSGITTVTIPYDGTGYPTAFIICLEDGAISDSTTNRYAIVCAYGVKRNFTDVMTYSGNLTADGFCVQCTYKGSSATSYSTGGSPAAKIGTQDNPSSSTSLFVSISSKTTFKFFTKSTSYGLLPGATYKYIILYSS